MTGPPGHGVDDGSPENVALDPAELTIRDGGPEDARALVALFDEAIAWLVTRGQTGQWGSEPYSSRPSGLAQARRLAAGGGLRLGHLDGEPVAALVLGDAPEYVPAADRAELYIQLLLTSRRRAGQHLGDRLVERAVAEATRLRCEQLRVDCWAGAPGLVGWYERHGFMRAGTFDLNGWRGQRFTMQLGKQPRTGDDRSEWLADGPGCHRPADPPRHTGDAPR